MVTQRQKGLTLAQTSDILHPAFISFLVGVRRESRKWKKSKHVQCMPLASRMGKPFIGTATTPRPDHQIFWMPSHGGSIKDTGVCQIGRWQWVLSEVLLMCVALLAAHGQYHQAWSSMLTNMPGSLPGVQTQYWFPEHSDLLFPAGELVNAPTNCVSCLAGCA